MKKYLLILFLLVLIVLFVASASRWNPLGQNIWKNFQLIFKKDKITEVVNVSDSSQKKINTDKDFYLKSDKNTYELGDDVRIKFLPNTTIATSKAKEILGEEIKFILTRPDGSVVESLSGFPPPPGFIPCDPLPGESSKCPIYDPDPIFSGGEMGAYYNYNYNEYSPNKLKGKLISEGVVNQIGRYKVTATTKVVDDYYFSIIQGHNIDELFIKKIGNYSMESKRKVDWNVTNAPITPDRFLASYVNSSKRNIIVEITFSTNKDYSDFSFSGSSIIKELNQNIYRGNSSYNYFWISNDKMILISGYQMKEVGSEEKSFLGEYLKKYPSSL